VENVIGVMMRKTFGSKEDKGTAEWRGLHNVEVNYLYSPNTARVIKPRRIDRQGM
jgi:hypothetical protein